MAALLASSALTAASLPAAAYTFWTGANSSDWFTAGNWDTGIVPSSGAGDSVIINNTNPAGVGTVVGGPAAETGGLFVGWDSSGQLTVQNGGTLDSGYGGTGYFAGSSGTVTVTGTGSVWNGGVHAVGFEGAGVLNVQSGGIGIFNSALTLGNQAGSTGTATVSGAGSAINAGGFTVGKFGTGVVNVQNGASVTVSDQTFLGAEAGSSGTVTVTGPGSAWSSTTISSSAFSIGGSGTGTFNVQNGASVTNITQVSLGTLAGSLGTVTVTGAGSLWVSSNYIDVGEVGTGIFNLEAGGEFRSTRAFIGSTASGTVTVTGAGSLWKTTNDIIAGFGGTGIFNVQNGGAVQANETIVGYSAGSNGTNTVTGAGSTWTTATSTTLGREGTGIFNVENGGVAQSATTILGSMAGSSGTITVTGTGSTWTSTTSTTIGSAGTGIFNVQNTGAVQSATTIVGSAAGGSGTVNLIGAGSTWTSTTSTTIGSAGAGVFNVQNNPTANLAALTVGNSTGTGRLAVDSTSQANANTYTQGANGTYAVSIAPAAAGKIAATGAAALGGTLQAVATGGTYTAGTQYNILHANGGITGTFASLTTSGSFGTLRPQLSYDADDVFLTLAQGLIGPRLSGASGNQNSVATGIDTAINNGATLNSSFDTLLGLEGAALSNALDQASGQPATGGTAAGMQATSFFLSLMLNPFGGAPDSNLGTLSYARGFGAGEKQLSPQAAEAYAAVTPKDRRIALDPRWGVWGQVYGGNNKTDGDASAGTTDTSSNTWGLATGFDYRVTPDTLLGFALAGGSTSWGLSQNLGGGSGEMFQVGAFGSRKFGAAYLSAALSYAWHGMDTERTVTVGGTSVLVADFDAHSFGGRVENGYQFAASWMDVTPYGALQVQNFQTPTYSERASSGSGAFALMYDSQSTTATRTEMGAWFDKTITLDRGNALALRGRLAWAHDFDDDDDGINAVFQTLPGSNFTVNGAAGADDSALLSAGAELRLANNISLGTKFDGEFSESSQTYAGTGTVKYVW